MNNTTNIELKFDEEIRDWFVMFLYLLTAILAIIGNIFICAVIINKQQMRSTTYILIFSMAISDLIGGIVIPGQWFVCSHWFLGFGVGERFCGLTKSSQILSYYVSTFTMTAIAYDRYKLILHPLKPRMKPTIPTSLTWILGILFTSTTLYSMRVSEYFSPKQGVIGCRVIFAHDISFLLRKLRVLIVMSTQYIIPLLITAYLYGRVMHAIWQREHVGNVSDQKKEKLDKNKKKTVKMLIVVVVLFALAWFPVHLMHFLKFYTNIIPLAKGKCNATTFYMICYWLGISSCCYNAFIYCYFNSDFRLEAFRYWNMFFPICKIKMNSKGKKDELESDNSNITVSSNENKSTSV